MTTGLVDAPTHDVDPHRPGVQLLVDLWVVHTSDGFALIAAPQATLAERWVVHTVVSSGNPAPKVHSTRLAGQKDIDGFLEDVALVLDIMPGPIPADRLEEAARTLGPLRLSTYRQLTERQAGEATELAPLKWQRPVQYRLRGLWRPEAGWWALTNIAGLLLYVLIAIWPWLARTIWLALISDIPTPGFGTAFSDEGLLNAGGWLAWVGPFWIIFGGVWLVVFLLGTEDWINGRLVRPNHDRRVRYMR